jgi:hypothetical protein
MIVIQFNFYNQRIILFYFKFKMDSTIIGTCFAIMSILCCTYNLVTFKTIKTKTIYDESHVIDVAL